MSLCVLLVTVIALRASPLQPDNHDITGEALMKHPTTLLAIKAAELVAAGKVDEAIALRTKSQISEFKSTPPGDKREFVESIKKMSPEPKAFAAAIRKSGSLMILANTGVMNAQMGKSRALTYFELEGGAWKVTNGPFLVETP